MVHHGALVWSAYYGVYMHVYTILMRMHAINRNLAAKGAAQVAAQLCYSATSWLVLEERNCMRLMHSVLQCTVVERL